MASPKVIVADDEKDLVLLVSTALEGDGFEVRTASNGKEALDLAQEEKPDLLVLDGLMPKVSGFDVCRKIKEEMYPSGAPKVLLMTAIYKKRQQKYEAMEIYKVDRVIYKPFELDDLLSTVRGMLGMAGGAGEGDSDDRDGASEGDKSGGLFKKLLGGD